MDLLIVVEIILDRGLVIDAYVRVSIMGIELLTIDARIVVASVDTYLRFAEATNRLDLAVEGGKALPGVLGELGGSAIEQVASNVAEDKVGDLIEKTAGKVEEVAEKAVDLVTPDREDDARGGRRG